MFSKTAARIVCVASLGLALGGLTAGAAMADVAAAPDETASAKIATTGMNAQKVTAETVDGGFVVTVSIDNDDHGWYADVESSDNVVVMLRSAEKVDGAFIANYGAVGDGEATVGVRHFYNATACDEAYTWDLVASDGEIGEPAGGSYTANSDDAELDPYLSGLWVADGDEPMVLTVSRGEDRGWDVAVINAQDEDGYVFKTTVYNDCVQVALVYDKGKFFELPADGAATGEGLGEAAIAGSTGSFMFTVADGDDDALNLVWSDEQNPAGDVIFERVLAIDLGNSELYTRQDVSDAAELVEEEFATWEGCQLYNIRYAGDECNTPDNVAWMNELAEGQDFVECIEFLSDFHSPVEGGGAWEADADYLDWQWWLARPEGGAWQLLTWGY